MIRSFNSAFVSFLAFFLLISCSDVTYSDIDSSWESEVTLRRYEVVGDVDAYSIRPHSRARAEYVSLIPPPGIEGREVERVVRVKKGTIVVITGVEETTRWMDCGLSFRVAVEGQNLGMEKVRIEMNRGNQGEDCLSLNPEIYQPLPN